MKTKRSFRILAVLLAALMLCACAGAEFPCEHCHEPSLTSNRLLGNVDMELCDDCYIAYLLGEWGSEFSAAVHDETSRPTTAAETQPPAPETTAPPPLFLEVWREGEVSQIPAQTVRGSVGNYTVAIDPEYFTFLPQEGYDLFSYEAWRSEHPVYFTVTPYPGAYDPEHFAQECLLAYSSAYAYAEDRETAVGSYSATLVSLDGSKDAPGYCRHFYLLSCGETCYAIEAEFTLEMYDGLYAIMRAMFNTFTVEGA